MVVQAGDLFVQPHFRRTTKSDADSLKISAAFILATHSPCKCKHP